MKYAHVCVTCANRETCEWNNGYFLTCGERKEDKEYKPIKDKVKDKEMIKNEFKQY